MRRFLFSVSAAAIVAAGSANAVAQEWPNRPVRFLVGFAPGGTTDIIARKLAPELGSIFGTNFVVENRPGASGMIASAELARAAPDGYTIGMVISSNVSVPAIGRKLPFHPISSFAPVVLVGQVPLVFALSNQVKASTLQEFVTMAKERPAEFTFSSPGIGLAHHFTGELFKLQAGISMTHVPYSGAAPALTDVVGGQVSSTFAAVPTAAPSIESGKVKALGLSGKAEAPRLPKVQPIASLGYPDFEITEWYGVSAPAGTPEHVVARLNEEINKLLDKPEWQKWLLDNAVIRPSKRTADDFVAFIEEEAVKFDRIARDANIREQQ